MAVRHVPLLRAGAQEEPQDQLLPIGLIMGDMADYALECGANEEDHYDDYFSGRMSNWDAYENGIINELGGLVGTERKAPTSKTCRSCGMGGLRWGQLNDKWLLHGKHGVHVCPKNPYNAKFGGSSV